MKFPPRSKLPVDDPEDDLDLVQPRTVLREVDAPTARATGKRVLTYGSWNKRFTRSQSRQRRYNVIIAGTRRPRDQMRRPNDKMSRPLPAGWAAGTTASWANKIMLVLLLKARRQRSHSPLFFVVLLFTSACGSIRASCAIDQYPDRSRSSGVTLRRRIASEEPCDGQHPNHLFPLPRAAGLQSGAASERRLDVPRLRPGHYDGQLGRAKGRRDAEAPHSG